MHNITILTAGISRALARIVVHAQVLQRWVAIAPTLHNGGQPNTYCTYWKDTSG